MSNNEIERFVVKRLHSVVLVELFATYISRLRYDIMYSQCVCVNMTLCCVVLLAFSDFTPRVVWRCHNKITLKSQSSRFLLYCSSIFVFRFCLCFINGSVSHSWYFLLRVPRHLAYRDLMQFCTTASFSGIVALFLFSRGTCPPATSVLLTPHEETGIEGVLHFGKRRETVTFAGWNGRGLLDGGSITYV